MAVSAGTAYVDIYPNMAGFAAGVTSGMAKVGAKLRSTGRQLSAGLTLPLVGAGVAVSRLSLSFSDALTQIRALVGASDKQMARYREGILKLSTESTKGPTELAESLYYLASSGFEGAAALRILRASAKASSAGLGDTQSVASTVAAAVNAYGEKALSASAATDVLVAAVREGTAEPAELANALGRVIAPAEAVGVEFGEVGGAVAGLTLTGLNAAEAVTALRGVLVTFLGPGKQAKDTLKEFGMTSKGVQEAIAKDGLLPALQDIRDTFGENRDAMRKVFPNIRAFNGFLSLTGKNAKKNAEAIREVTNSTGDTDKAFRKASEAVGFKFRNAIARLQASLITFGDILLPIVADVADKLAGLARGFANLPPTAQKLIVWAGIIAAALGPVMFIMGSLIGLTRGLVTALVSVERTAAGAAKFKAGWALALATNPWVLAGVAIAGVAAAILLVGERSDDSTREIEELTDATREYTIASGELNDSARDLEQAELDVKRSTIGLKRARQGLTKTMKDENSTVLQRREARLAVEQAELDHAAALDRLTDAQNRNRESQRKFVATRKEAEKQLGQVTQALRREIFATGRAKERGQDLADVQRDLVKNLDPAKLYRFVDGVIANSAAFGRTQKQAQKAREDIANFIRETGRVPEKEELRVLVDAADAKRQLGDVKQHLDAIQSKTITITLLQRGKTAPIGTNAAGTDDWRGGWSWVGEEGPELLNLPRHSQVVPTSRLSSLNSGGAKRITITNWNDGTGYMEEISDGSVAGNNRFAGQRARMRR